MSEVPSTMSGTTTIDTIRTMRDELGMSVEQIAACEGLSVEAVTLAVMNNCENKGKIHETVENTADESYRVFGPEDISEAGNIMMELARVSEVDKVRLEATKFVINEAQGRHKPENKLGNTSNLNNNLIIASINMEIRKAREARNAMVSESPPDTLINI